MYWDETPSRIDSILQQEDVTLEMILDEDDVLQECHGNNEQLVKFLTKGESIIKMLSIMTQEPPLMATDSPTETIAENYKYANTICEIFTHDENVFAKIVAENRRYLSILWTFLDKSCLNDLDKPKGDNLQRPEGEEGGQELEEKQSVESLDEQSNNMQQSDSKTVEETAEIQKQLNPLLASFFTKVFLYMFTHNNEPIMDFIMSRTEPNDLVTVILRHIKVSAIMDFILKTWEHVNAGDSKPYDPRFNQLLVQHGFVEKLIEVFKHENLESEQQNVAQLISDMVKGKREILTNSSLEQEEILSKFEFESVQTIRTLLENMFICRTKNSIVNGLKIIQVLLQYNLHVQNMFTQQEAQLSSMIRKGNDEQQNNDVELEPMPKILKQPPNMSEMRFVSPHLSSPDGSQGEYISRCVSNVSNALNERLEDFVSLLTDTSKCQPIKSTVGLIEKPLGLVRLEVVHLFVALFATCDFHIMEKCSQLHVLEILTDLFFTYTLNNQLHKYYELIISYILQNYHNFKLIHDKHHSNNNSNCNDLQSEEEQTKDEENYKKNSVKVSYFLDLYNISKILVHQILKDCRLIEKILENYANEKIPVKSFSWKKSEKEEDYTIDDNDEVFRDDDVEMKNESSTNDDVDENVSQPQAEDDKNDIVIDEIDKKSNEKLAPSSSSSLSRPGYMGHLFLIANILEKHCNEDLMKECDLENLIPEWREFVDGKLKQLNKLIGSELVPESKRMIKINANSMKDEETFLNYQTEFGSEMNGPNLSDGPRLLPNDFVVSPVKSISEKLSLKNDILDSEISDSLNKDDDFFKEFNATFKRDRSKNKSEDNDGNGNVQQESDDPFDDKPHRTDLFIKKITLKDFASCLSKDFNMPKLSNEDSLEDFEDYFTSLDAFNFSNPLQPNTNNSESFIENNNPWAIGDTSSSSTINNLSGICSSKSSNNKIVNDDNWANFSNEDPFLSAINTNPNMIVGHNSNVDNDVVVDVDDENDNVFASNITSSSSPKKVIVGDDDDEGKSNENINENDGDVGITTEDDKIIITTGANYDAKEPSTYIIDTDEHHHK